MDDSTYCTDEVRPMFYIGEHETKRSLPVTAELIHHAQDLGYDMLTTPITNEYFQSRVLGLLSSFTQAIEESTQTQPLPLIPALKNVDTPLAPDDFISQLLGFTSSWIDLGSPDPVIAHLSRQVFNLEIAYAAFCGVVTVVVPGPRLTNGTSGVAQYARAIKQALSTGAYVQLHIQMPMDGSQVSQDEDLGDLARFVRPEYGASNGAKSSDPLSAWDAWNTIRSICTYHNRLSVALDVPKKLPSLAVQSRWYSEPIRLLILSAQAFVSNEKSNRVLHRTSQLFILRCMRLKTAPWLLLADVGPIPGVEDPDMLLEYSSGYLSPGAAADAPSPASSMGASPTPAEAAHAPKKAGKKSSNHDPTPYLSYLRFMQRNQPPQTQIERFGGGFQDYLQSPLQPLADNLESITYEVFEKDPIKYAWYEEAIARALNDWKTQEKSTSSENGAVVIAVVGSGRGPLVTRALDASERTGVPVRVYAIEKNPNAYVVLLRHNREQWGGRVEVVKTDMRAWKGPNKSDGTCGKVDILVSELLGSFADNELSPECLDGVQHVLNSNHGISIPASYTAHMTPIATPKLYADVISRRTHGDSSAFEIPWVVMFSQFDYLSIQPNQPKVAAQLSDGRKMKDFELSAPLAPIVHTAWEFRHPLPPTVLAQASLRRGGSAVGGGGGFMGGDGANEHNVRHCSVTFPIQEQGMCHGIAGYFETVLYSGSEGPVELSTTPVTMDEKSKDMISWFPIFFPLKTPIQIPANSELEVSMWRQTDDRKVWYEWLVEAFTTINGQRIRLSISDLHSSKSNGCLM